MRIFAQAVAVCISHPTLLNSVQLRNQVGDPPHIHYDIERQLATFRQSFHLNRGVLTALGLPFQAKFRAAHAHVLTLFSNRDLFRGVSLLRRAAVGGVF